MCQIKNIAEMGLEDPTLKIKKHTNNVLKKLGISLLIKKTRSFKDRKILLKNQNSKNFLKNPKKGLKPGDKIRVRSKEQIMQTLDKENKLEGCYFMEDMWKYCGTEQKVLKRINYFYDERGAEYYKAYNTVILEGIFCSGKLANLMPKCDRNCFLFWREEWLEKIEK